MSFTNGLSVLIILCAIGVLVTSFRVPPESRLRLRVVGVAFLLMGGADFLEPVSSALATAVNAVAVLILVGVAARGFFFGEQAQPKS